MENSNKKPDVGREASTTSDLVSDTTEGNTLSDIGTLTKALKDVGIDYSIRTEGEYEYLFIGERRDIYSMNNGEFKDFFDDDLELLRRRHSYYEFEDGNLVSHP